MTNFVYNAILNLLAANGLGVEATGLILIGIVALMYSIQDFRIGLMIAFIGSIAEFIFLYLFNLDYSFALIAIFLSLILLAFSIYSTRNGGQIV